MSSITTEMVNIGRRQCIPIIYTRGTHYQVGFDVGRTFSGLIQNFIKIHSPLHETFLPAYGTVEGRHIYESTLKCVEERFPQYLDEIRGTANGAQVPFHILFLLHLDKIITNGGKCYDDDENGGSEGCSTICVNRNGLAILGHTEDALTSTLNHFYFVSAHIISNGGGGGEKEERFTSLCYAGHLPGYTMSYNYHGLVFSINTLSAERIYSAKTPRYFITRALLAAENFHQAEQIVRDKGSGAAEGCSINMTFLAEDRLLFYNIEMAPPQQSFGNESRLNIFKSGRGEMFIHCNKYLRLNVKEENDRMIASSIARMCTLEAYQKPCSKNDVIEMLANRTGTKFKVFQDFQHVKTIAVGIFDCIEKTWTIYADNPKETEPLLVLPLILKKDYTF